jgi:hypothetical protein
MADQDGYRAYLLRLWQARDVSSTRWRASLEDPRTGTRLGFSSIARLHDFLIDQTGEASQQRGARPAAGEAPEAPGDDMPDGVA